MYTPEEIEQKVAAIIARQQEEKRVRNRRSYHKNIAQNRQRNRDKYAADKAKHSATVKRAYIRRTYGISIEERDALLASQGGLCAICGARDPGRRGDWLIDHDHRSDAVRGILCHSCNTGLGHFDDNIETLKDAISYLEKHSGRERTEARPELTSDAGAGDAPGEGL